MSDKLPNVTSKRQEQSIVHKTITYKRREELTHIMEPEWSFTKKDSLVCSHSRYGVVIT